MSYILRECVFPVDLVGFRNRKMTLENYQSSPSSIFVKYVRLLAILVGRNTNVIWVVNLVCSVKNRNYSDGYEDDECSVLTYEIFF